MVMKNLIPLDEDNNQSFRTVINVKRGERRLRLNRIINTIETQYGLYEQNKLNLSQINCANIVGIDKADLIHCYEHATSPLNLVLARIKEAQPSEYGVKCQYCGLNVPDTFDHYLPKTSFPEFSILAINLIPCCPKCNEKKGDSWLGDDGNRVIVNMYFDPMPQVKYIFASVEYLDNVPLIRFRVENTNGIDNTTFNLLKAHYKKLDLLKRYKEKMNEIISETMGSTVAYVRNASGISVEAISGYLFDVAGQKRQQFGTNYWEAAVIEALSDSEEFINSCL
jgi:5-methylcytosine-specific restriction endonuclease McrA